MEKMYFLYLKKMCLCQFMSNKLMLKKKKTKTHQPLKHNVLMLLTKDWKILQNNDSRSENKTLDPTVCSYLTIFGL